MVTRVTPSMEPDLAVAVTFARDIDASIVGTNSSVAAAARSDALCTRCVHACTGLFAGSPRAVIQRVVAHWMPDVLEMQANLMRPPRLELAQKERGV